ncbi:MAG: (2Fe-2S) ferredoxin domain-containing protein [Deltaproteobacteria bacterium]|nr:(2Fe-2S) ferredoxin domain-containing protein [Deltaproteobacteria bacterium]
MRVTSISSLKKTKNRGLKSLFPSKTRLSVGLGSCGIAAGAESVYNALKKEAAKRKLDVVITKTGCLGFVEKSL